MWFLNSKSRNSTGRWISPLQGKGLMFLALVFFTESIMVTKAVRTVEAFGGGSKSTHNHQQCSNSKSGNYQCDNPVAPPVVQRIFGVPRGGDAVAATVGAAKAAAASDALVTMPKDALETKPNIIATGCPYCNTMMTDGIKFHEKEAEIEVKDIAELIAEAEQL